MFLALAALTGFSLPAQAQQVYVSQIIELGTNFCPIGFFPTDGRLLPISQYAPLFSLIGTQYGGNGVTNFALPQLVPPLTVQRQPTTLCIAWQGIFPSRP